MHITLLAYGSRGDVEPFVALGKGLSRAGYRVRLAAPEIFASLVRSSDIEFSGLPGDPRRLVQGLVDSAGKNWLRMVRSVSQFALPLGAQVLAAAQAACEGTEAIIHSFLLTIAGHEIATAQGIPDLSAQMFPVFSPTVEFPGIVFPDLPLGNLYRRATHQVVGQTFWQGSRLLYGRVRRTSPHLPRLTRWPFRADNHRSPPILYAFSSQVVPRPHDWREDVHVTGYWFSEDETDWQPPEGLVAFLQAGPPPVCVGFGSTVTRDRDRLARVVLEALKKSRQRGVIVGTGLALERPSAAVLQVDYAPYGWLFPRAAAVVHHGGAGTTGQGLRAGIPNIVVPFTSDQPFWGRRVYELGAGPAPIPAARLSAEKLADAIAVATHDSQMRRRARAIGQAIQAEDGIGEAVAIIVRYLDATSRWAFAKKPQGVPENQSTRGDP